MMWPERGWRTVITILALTVLLAVLVGFIVYVYEERLGGLAYLIAQATAAIAAVGVIAWMTHKASK